MPLVFVFLGFWLELLLTVPCPAHVQASTYCCVPSFNWEYSSLFSKLEEALVSNKTVLDLLRHGFMRGGDVQVDFDIKLQVVNGTYLSNCDNIRVPFDYPLRTFDTLCPSNSSEYKWELCNIPGGKGVRVAFSSQTTGTFISKMEKDKIHVSIVWLSLLHGSLLSTFVFAPYYRPTSLKEEGNYNGDYSSQVSLTLRMDTLNCNPSVMQTQFLLTDLIGWVSLLISILLSHIIAEMVLVTSSVSAKLCLVWQGL